jgi:hypothetical protein
MAWIAEPPWALSSLMGVKDVSSHILMFLAHVAKREDILSTFPFILYEAINPWYGKKTSNMNNDLSSLDNVKPSAPTNYARWTLIWPRYYG